LFDTRAEPGKDDAIPDPELSSQARELFLIAVVQGDRATTIGEASADNDETCGRKLGATIAAACRKSSIP